MRVTQHRAGGAPSLQSIRQPRALMRQPATAGTVGVSRCQLAAHCVK
jgi:hypothetical protein